MRPKSFPFWFTIRRLPTILRSPLAYIVEMAQQGEPIISLGAGILPVFLINHPEAVNQILVAEAKKFYRGSAINNLRDFLGNGLLTSNGEQWRNQRQLVQPAFRSHAIAPYAHAMDIQIMRYLGEWEQSLKTDSQIKRNITQDMLILAQNNILAALFDIHHHPEAQVLHHSLATIQHTIISISLWEAVGNGLGAIFGKKTGKALYDFLVSKQKKAYDEAKATIQHYVRDLITTRKIDLLKNHPNNHVDLFSQLVRAQEEGKMSERQLEDEVITLFLAGFDTTGHTLSWLWYLLSKHPDIQENIRSELYTLPPDADAATLAQASLPYLEATIQEVLRLYPVAWVSLRSPLEKVNIVGYDIPKKASIVITPYTLQRLPSYWPDPEKFDPTRFLNRNLPDVMGAYIPFGAGPHTCIGKRLALLEIKMIVARVIKAYRVEDANHKNPKPKAMITLAAHPDIHVRVSAYS
ncbi:MAG: cytochrome P450 [Bacteroidetes Order II. Incertae sedis bacterium]|nr:cytochrome P450 [Bacteroidetes Order II. bacterium]